METLIKERKHDTTKDEMVGGWSTFNCKIDQAAFNAFDDAMKGLVGIKYVPFAVANQVVNGINYRFFCNTRMITEFPVNYSTMVTIFKPLNKKAVLKAIEPIRFNNF